MTIDNKGDTPPGADSWVAPTSEIPVGVGETADERMNTLEAAYAKELKLLSGTLEGINISFTNSKENAMKKAIMDMAAHDINPRNKMAASGGKENVMRSLIDTMSRFDAARDAAISEINIQIDKLTEDRDKKGNEIRGEVEI